MPASSCPSMSAIVSLSKPNSRMRRTAGMAQTVNCQTGSTLPCLQPTEKFKTDERKPFSVQGATGIHQQSHCVVREQSVKRVRNHLRHRRLNHLAALRRRPLDPLAVPIVIVTRPIDSLTFAPAENTAKQDWRKQVFRCLGYDHIPFGTCPWAIGTFHIFWTLMALTFCTGCL